MSGLDVPRLVVSATTAVVNLALLGGLAVLVWRLPKMLRTRRTTAQAGAQRKASDQAADQAFRARFAHCQVFESPIDHSFLAIDFDSQRIHIGKLQAVTEYEFGLLRSAEVVQAGGSLVSAPLYNAGEFIGTPEQRLVSAEFAKTNTIKTIGEVILRVKVDDPKRPVYDLLFMRVGQLGADPNDPPVRRILDAAEAVRTLLDNAMARAKARVDANADGGHVDALSRLWDLKQAGALSDDEFATEKAKLLASS